MDNTYDLKTGKCDLTHFLNFVRQISFLLFFLLSGLIYAQQETKFRSFSIQAGVNSDLLSGGPGPSISFHYAHPTEKQIQFESMLFYDSQSGGKTFLNGFSQEAFGYGLAAGARLNILPDKNWNPSLVLMPGVIYSSVETSREDDPGQSGVAAALCIAVSNTFYKKHMLSLGHNGGSHISATYLKYGYWF